MKNLLLIPVLLFGMICFSQPKPKKKEQLPTQKEMQEMMKEMQQAMGDMNEEDKRIMDSMGFKMPDTKNMHQMASFALANAGKAAPEVIVPKRDAARIASLHKTTLTSATLASYLQSVHQKITQTLPAGLQQKTLQQLEILQQQNKGKNITATAAIGYFMFGNTKAALFLISQACLENPTDDNNLNNLAAILNMSGGEHLALPILQLLNKQYPKHSTILNNIAHAWFGLGDVANASKYIDSTIRLCAWHPQANQIKAAIEESKGNQDAAVKAAKQAISRMHTPEKERALKDLGYNLKNDDIHWNPRNKPDQLGLSKFEWPGIPKSLSESEELEPVWKGYRKNWEAKFAELKAQHERQMVAYQEAFQRRLKQDLEAAQNGSASLATMEGVAPKAIIKLRPYVDDLLEREAKEPVGEALIRLRHQVDSLSFENSKELRRINESMAPGGEGIGINEGYCAAVDAANNNFLNEANTLVEAVCKKYRDRVKKRIMELVNFKLYSEFPEKIELSVLEAKIEWLSYMIMPYDVVVFRSRNALCRKVEKKKEGTMFALADFEDVTCSNRSTMRYIIGSIEINCSRTIAKIDKGPIKLDWESRSADREENRNFWDEFQRCTIEASIGESKKLGNGPLQLEASAEVTGFLEFDRTGLKDAGIKAEIGVGVKTNVLDNKVDTKGATVNVSGKEVGADIGDVRVSPSEKSLSFGGAEATISINCGFTAGGTGILKGVRL